MPREDLQPGRFTAEADAAVLLVLVGLGYQSDAQNADQAAERQGTI
jgi:hypothetical protein